MSSLPDIQSAAGGLPPQLAYAALPALGPAGGGTDSGAGLGDVWRVIKQRKITVAVTFLILYALVVAATLAIYRYAPAYPSEALIELTPPRQDVFEAVDPLPDPEDMRQQIETEARKLKRLDLLLEVLGLPEIKRTRFYAWYGDDFKECLYDLQRLVTSAPIPETNLIRVGLALRHKEESRMMVDTIVKRYLAKYNDEARESLQRRVNTLKDTLAKLNATQKDARGELGKFRQQSDVPANRMERNVSIDRIAELSKDLADLMKDESQLQTKLDTYKGVNDPTQLPYTAEMQMIVESDPILRFYRSQVESIDIEMRVAQETLMGENHRSMQQLRVRRQGYVEKESAKREELMDQLKTRQIDGLEQALAENRAAQLRLQDQLEEAEAEKRDQDRNLQRYSEMEEDEKRLNDQIQIVETRVKEAEHALADLSSFRLTIVQTPQEAVKPSRPDFVLYLGGGVVFALLGGLGLAFLREFTDKAIRTPLDVVRHGHLAVLGSVPLLDDEEADVDEIEYATRRAPQSLVAEAFRQIRTHLMFSGPAESRRVLLITSPSPGDGKTAVAINLAVTLAQGNARILLVDCNFRRPAIRHFFPAARVDGLSNLLIGQGRLQDLATPTDVPGLDVVSSGQMPPNPAELLGSKYKAQILEEARRKYDFVVLDGPPALLISDAMVISRQVDGVILVARAVNNSRGALKRARDQLERIHARVIGAVLNCVQARAGGYFKRMYREFYDYTSDETIPKELPAAPGAPNTMGDGEDART
jgi:capsular exopolysaccharide synthesis family protein